MNALCKKFLIVLNQQFHCFLFLRKFLYGHEAIEVWGAHEAGGEDHCKVLAVHSVLTLHQLHSAQSTHTHTERGAGSHGKQKVGGHWVFLPLTVPIFFPSEDKITLRTSIE